MEIDRSMRGRWIWKVNEKKEIDAHAEETAFDIIPELRIGNDNHYKWEDTSPVDFLCRLIENLALLLSHETDSKDIYLRRACCLVKTEQ